MENQLAELQRAALAAIAERNALSELQELKVQYLGKKGALTAFLRGMGGLAPEERPRIGQLVNDVRQVLEQAIGEKETTLAAQVLSQKLASEKIDITLPGRRVWLLALLHLSLKVIQPLPVSARVRIIRAYSLRAGIVRAALPCASAWT